MEIALVHDNLTVYGGAERVLQAFAQIYPNAPVFTASIDYDRMPDEMRRWDVHTTMLQRLPRRVSDAIVSSRYPLPLILGAMDLSQFDVVLSSVSFAAKGVKTSKHATHVCYCHLPTKFAWTSRGRLHDNPVARTLLYPLDHAVRRWDYNAAQRVTEFAVPSREVQGRIRKYYDRESTVLYPPINTPVRPVNRKPGDYFLVVSRLEKSKNTDKIIKAATLANVRLKIAGTGPQEKTLREIAGSNIEFLGFVSDDDLPELYGNAQAAVVGKLDEDLGLTVVEAMRYGCPVIAPFAGGYKETVIPGTNGIFIDNIEPETIANGIRQIPNTSFNKDTIIRSVEAFSFERFSVALQTLVDTTRTRKLKS